MRPREAGPVCGRPWGVCQPIARRRRVLSPAGASRAAGPPARSRGALSSRKPGEGSFTKFYSLFLIRANFYINGTCKRVRLPPVQTNGGRSLLRESKIKPELTTCWKGILRAPIFT